MANEPSGTIETGRESYLPDLCAGRSVFAVVLIAELIAISLSLVRYTSAEFFWTDLTKSSLFLLWISLTCAAVLCIARPHLGKLSIQKATVISLLLLVGTATLVSEATYLLGQFLAVQFIGPDNNLFPDRHVQFLIQIIGISTIVSVIVLRYFYVSYEWKRNVEAEARSRIHALQARIRPHFLFNSLNTIAELTRSNPERAEEAVEDLADLFRVTLGDARTRIRLKEELEIARIYQRIEQLRLGDRLQVVWNVADIPMRTQLPGLLVQPLLENAIYHGIENLPDGGIVTVDGSVDNGIISIAVTNPLPASGRKTPRDGNRQALSNVRQRLELAYPGQASVDVQQSPEQFRVCLKFPAQERTE